MNKALFKDKFIGYHTFGLKLLNIKVNSEIKYEYVDLGLPSGNLWATRNIGATSDTDPGLYFLWGDIKGYALGLKSFDTDTYKYYDEQEEYTKYTESDGLNELLSQDDAACVIMGKEWSIPNNLDIAELLENTTQLFIENSGVLFTSKVNGKTLFIPSTNLGYFDTSIQLPSYSAEINGIDVAQSTTDDDHDGYAENILYLGSNFDHSTVKVGTIIRVRETSGYDGVIETSKDLFIEVLKSTSRGLVVKALNGPLIGNVIAVPSILEGTTIEFLLEGAAFHMNGMDPNFRYSKAYKYFEDPDITGNYYIDRYLGCPVRGVKHVE